jgi:hypothetical protein
VIASDPAAARGRRCPIRRPRQTLEQTVERARSDVRVDWYQQVFVETGRSAALWALVGFLVTFAITRGITRRIPGQKKPTGR